MTDDEIVLKYSQALQNGDNSRMYLRGETFSILKCGGYTSYGGRASGLGYNPVSLIIVKNGTGYWDRQHKTIHRGRISKDDKDRIRATLALAEYDQSLRSIVDL